MKKFEKGAMFVKSIKVDGKETHAGADLLYMMDDNDGSITLKTEIGKNKNQELIIELVEDNTNLIEDNKKSEIDEKKTSSD